MTIEFMVHMLDGISKHVAYVLKKSNFVEIISNLQLLTIAYNFVLPNALNAREPNLKSHLI